MVLLKLVPLPVAECSHLEVEIMTSPWPHLVKSSCPLVTTVHCHQFLPTVITKNISVSIITRHRAIKKCDTTSGPCDGRNCSVVTGHNTGATLWTCVQGPGPRHRTLVTGHTYQSIMINRHW